jgi:hypothetical protein
MVVLGRLRFIREQIDAGAEVRIGFLSSGKVKIRIDPSAAVTLTSVRQLLLLALAATFASVPDLSATDRGHRHRDGTSKISIWLRPPRTSPGKVGQAMLGEVLGMQLGSSDSGVGVVGDDDIGNIEGEGLGENIGP